MDEIVEAFKVLERLSTFKKSTIQLVLGELLKQEKLDFVDLSTAYVRYLQGVREDSKLKLADANSCTLSLLSGIRKETKNNKSAVHWALYNLNESRQFQMNDLNEKFGYDKDKDCNLSFYYREKNEGKH